MKTKEKSALRWIVKNSKGQWLNIVLLSVFYAVYAYIGVYISVLSKHLVDSAVNKNRSALVYYAVMFLSIIILQICMSLLSKNLIFKVAAKLEISMKTGLFASMTKKEYKDITSYHSGELLNRLTSDVAIVSGSVTSIIPSIVFFIVKIVGVFYIMTRIDIWFALVFAVGGAVVLACGNLFKPKTKKLHKQCQQTDGKTRSFLQETLSSLLVVKTFRAEQRVCDEANKYQNENYIAKRKRNIFSIFTSVGIHSIFSAGYLYGLVWGAFKIFSGAITYGTLTQIISLVSQIQSPIQGLTGVFPTYFTALASAERIMEIEALPDEVSNTADGHNIIKIWENYKSVCVDNISFSYSTDDVFDCTSLTIEKGDFIAMTGISGIGKSTLIKLLLGVYKPNSGSIYLVNSNGERHSVDKGTRPLIAYVPQGNFLLSGTIRENISFICPDATDDEIMTAARIACADTFINELPNGLDTVLQEKGQGISEGQIQRIAVARALLLDAPILLLDEATSALDEQTEIKLLNNIRAMKNKTCVIVSHKKAAITVCNKEVRIANKKLVLMNK